MKRIYPLHLTEVPGIWFSFVLLLFLMPQAAQSSEESSNSIVFYRGVYTRTTLFSILTQGSVEYRPSYLTVAGWNKPLEGRIRDLTFETELQLGVHSGIMKHVEVNGLLVARYELPEGFPFSFAFGEGLSVASREPDLEKYGPDVLAWRFESQYTRRVLNYLMVEMEFTGLRNSQIIPVRPFFRIHHRSGIYGIYCPPTCGSNFVTYGISTDI